MKKNAAIETETMVKAIVDMEPLTAEQESELSRRILAGEAARKVLAGNEAIASEEAEALRQTIADGDEAYGELVLANRPRAMKFAYRTWRKNLHGLNELEDYRQAALKVICECARSYDYRRGCRFSTYVHQSIQHEMIRENGLNAYAVALPEDRVCAIAPLRQRMDSMSKEEAARQLGLKPEMADLLLQTASCAKSLQDPVSADDPDTELGDTIADASAMTAEEIEEHIDKEAQLQLLRKAFGQLSDTEQGLLIGRFGLDGADPRPLKAFAGIYARSISGVQKKQIAAENHLREVCAVLPLAD